MGNLRSEQFGFRPHQVPCSPYRIFTNTSQIDWNNFGILKQICIIAEEAVVREIRLTEIEKGIY
jgi:hypothetical protein